MNTTSIPLIIPSHNDPSALEQPSLDVERIVRNAENRHLEWFPPLPSVSDAFWKIVLLLGIGSMALAVWIVIW